MVTYKFYNIWISGLSNKILWDMTQIEVQSAFNETMRENHGKAGTTCTARKGSVLNQSVWSQIQTKSN